MRLAKLEAVSVPLRGLWFLSPKPWTRTTGNTAGFRPLAGIMVLILTGYDGKINKFNHSSFRPLAGIMVLIEYRI